MNTSSNTTNIDQMTAPTHAPSKRKSTSILWLVIVVPLVVIYFRKFPDVQKIRQEVYGLREEREQYLNIKADIGRLGQEIEQQHLNDSLKRTWIKTMCEVVDSLEEFPVTAGSQIVVATRSSGKKGKIIRGFAPSGNHVFEITYQVFRNTGKQNVSLTKKEKVSIPLQPDSVFEVKYEFTASSEKPDKQLVLLIEARNPQNQIKKIEKTFPFRLADHSGISGGSMGRKWVYYPNQHVPGSHTCKFLRSDSHFLATDGNDRIHARISYSLESPGIPFVTSSRNAHQIYLILNRCNVQLGEVYHPLHNECYLMKEEFVQDVLSGDKSYPYLNSY